MNGGDAVQLAQAVQASQQALAWILGLASILGTLALAIFAWLLNNWATGLKTSIDTLNTTVATNKADLEKRVEETKATFTAALNASSERIHERIDTFSEELRDSERNCADARVACSKEIGQQFARKEALEAAIGRIHRIESDVTRAMLAKVSGGMS